MGLKPISIEPVYPWQAWLGSAIGVVLLFISIMIPTVWQQLLYIMGLFFLVIAYVSTTGVSPANQPIPIVLFRLIEAASAIVSALYLFFIVVYGYVPIPLLIAAVVATIVHSYMTFRLILSYYIAEDGKIDKGSIFELCIDVYIFLVTLIWLSNFEVFVPLTNLGLPIITAIIILVKEVSLVTAYFLLVMQMNQIRFSTVATLFVSWSGLCALLIIRYEFAITLNGWSMAMQILLLATLLRFVVEFFPTRQDLYIKQAKTNHFEYIRVYLLSFIVIGLLLYFVFNYNKVGIGNMLPQILSVMSAITLRIWRLIKSKRYELQESDELEEYLISSLTQDELTGLPNRTAIEQFISSQIARTDNINRYIITIDIDGFKLVNESLGHTTGDEVLLLVTKAILDVAHNALFVGRLASDKFVVIVEQGEQRIERLANDYLNTIIDSYKLKDGNEIRIGCSAGVSMINTKVDLHTNLESADAAITEAKFIGRGTVASRSITERSGQVNKVIRDAFTKAVSLRDFGLRWTPKVNLKTGDIVGNAATLFWHANPTLDAKQLHDLADEDRIAAELSAIELELGCAVIAKTQQPLTLGLRGRDLLNAQLPEQLTKLASQYNIGLSEIEFMLIDRAGLSRDSHAEIAVENLHNLGITLTLSEFGSGFFSFSQMRSIEIDAISVDEAVISQVMQDSKLNNILEAVVIASTGMALPVTAVGIESERVAERVSEAGCIFGIGPWFGRQSTMLYADALDLRRNIMMPASGYPLAGDYV